MLLAKILGNFCVDCIWQRLASEKRKVCKANGGEANGG